MQPGQVFIVLRRLLARIRDVMAGEDDAQQKLDRIVAVIAEDMVSEVCSVYVRRAGEVLELFATQGLKPSAVHVTRLRVGEGLVGQIAAKGRPMALAEAQSHPDFAYRPETGEDPFHSLMGVPILSGGRVLGVLVVQNVHRRDYADEDIEAMQTVAMVLAELVGRGELIQSQELRPAEGPIGRPLRLEGSELCGGIGSGVAVHHRPSFAIRRVVAEDAGHEQERLREAVASMHGALDDMLRGSGLEGGEHRDVLETYRMIAEDVGWLRRISEAISTGLTAEAAVDKVSSDMRARMGNIADPYLRERVHDLEDLAHRLLQALIGRDDDAAPPPAEDFVLVARTMGPAQLLDFDRRWLRGIVLEEGLPTTHVAIVAKALEIPAVGQVRDAMRRIHPGDRVIVDGDHTQVLVRPSQDVRQAFADAIATRAERRAAYVSLKDQPAVTRDGTRISVNINAGLLVDMTHLDEFGADGVGLYRTEVPFMVRSEYPDVASQQRLYERILGYAGDKPVAFRTLDVGGDKVLPYWSSGEEENPAMGWRAVRVSLDRPAMLRQQLRALIRAAAGRPLSVMFPMLTEVAEFEFARALLVRELAVQDRLGKRLPKPMRIGAMLEVPALLFQMRRLLDNIDFLSIGTNDLIQFLFATDRANAHMAERYDELSPVVLRVLKGVAAECDAAGVPVSVCGEMAGRPLDAMALVGIGFRNISMPPSSVGPVKTMIRNLDLPALEKYIAGMLDEPQTTLRPKLRAYGRDRRIVI